MDDGTPKITSIRQSIYLNISNEEFKILDRIAGDLGFVSRPDLFASCAHLLLYGKTADGKSSPNEYIAAYDAIIAEITGETNPLGLAEVELGKQTYKTYVGYFDPNTSEMNGKVQVTAYTRAEYAAAITALTGSADFLRSRHGFVPDQPEPRFDDRLRLCRRRNPCSSRRLGRHKADPILKGGHAYLRSSSVSPPGVPWISQHVFWEIRCRVPYWS